MVEMNSRFEELSDLIGEIASGRVVHSEGENIVVDLGVDFDGVEVSISSDQRVPSEKFRSGDVIRGIVWEVKRTKNGVYVTLSRKCEDFVARLLEIGVPEVAEELIEIKRIVRDAGYRTEIAVAATEEVLDPVAVCASRADSIVRELQGETLDFVRW